MLQNWSYHTKCMHGEGTPYDGQCTMLGGLDPHFRAWIDPLESIFELGSIH